MKRISVIVTALLLIVSLTGCQLARPEKTGGSTENITGMIGVVVTEGKMYSGQKAFADFDGERYRFDNIEGIPFFCASYIEGDEKYAGLTADGRVSGGSQNINIGDGSESLAISGTIYTDGSREMSFFLNPVYQDADGSVFILPDDVNGTYCNVVPEDEGTVTVSLEDKYTLTDNGAKKENTFSVSLSFERKAAAELVTVYEMGGEYTVVSSKAFSPYDIPEKIVPSTDLLLVVCVNSDGSVTHQAVGRGEESFKVFRPAGNGLISAVTVYVEWGEEASA